jgi:GNAT superfamily N-acetyltransferase
MRCCRSQLGALHRGGSRFVKTRPLTAADAPSIAELWLAGMHESASVDPTFRPRVSCAEYAVSLAQAFSAGQQVGWGAFDARETLLGYLTANVVEANPEFEQARHLFLLDLDIRSARRRQGIGSALVQLARSHATQQGIATVEVGWLLPDPRSTAFWRHQGFAPYFVRGRSFAVVGQPLPDVRAP